MLSRGPPGSSRGLLGASRGLMGASRVLPGASRRLPGTSRGLPGAPGSSREFLDAPGSSETQEPPRAENSRMAPKKKFKKEKIQKTVFQIRRFHFFFCSGATFSVQLNNILRP